jgi:hypothetical protein
MYYTIKDLNKLSPSLAKKIAQEQGTQRQWHPAYADIPDHPRCSTADCGNPRIVMDYHWTSGKPVYRPVCSDCHNTVTAQRYALRHGAEWIKNIADVVAHKAGYTSATAYLNAKHPYRQYRKDYCENIDGRLGYVCTTTILWDGQLDSDHIDENPSHNDPSNIQTLCKCCHAYKGNVFVKAHGRTPGRKFYGLI